MSGCGRGCHCRPGAAGFGGRLGHCVLHGADVLLGRHVKQGFIERRRPGVAALRALAAAMLITGKRNRLPQNVVGRDNRSSQCSLLW